jgi:hypothetical protein
MQLLLFSVLAVPVCISVYAPHETTFLVGPCPQPLFPDNGSGDDSKRPNDLLLPPASSQIVVWDGVRNLKAHNPCVAKASESDKPNRRSTVPIDHERLANFDGRFDDATGLGPRSLEGVMCNITTTLLGFNPEDIWATTGHNLAPLDPSGAAGVHRLVAVGNLIVEVRHKNGTLTFRHGFQSFYSSFPEALDTDYFHDAKVIYNEHAGRFLILVMPDVLQEEASPQVARFWLAMSKDETPDSASDWHKGYIDSIVVIDGNKTRASDPSLEVDAEAIYITARMLKFSGGSAGIRLWILDKGVIDGFFAGQSFNFSLFNPFVNAGFASTTRPAQVHGSSGVDGSVGTFLCSVLLYSSRRVSLQIVAVFNPLSVSPTYTLQEIDLGIMVQNFTIPPAPQNASSCRLSTGSIQATDAVWRNNKLWVIFTFIPPSGVNQGQATVHWVRCKTHGGTVTFEAQGDLGGEGIAPGTSTYFPSIAVNSHGLAAYGYSASSPTTYVGAFVSAGMSEPSYVVKTGSAPYGHDCVGQTGWGYYSGISVDPTDDSFWVFNQFVDTLHFGLIEPATAWGRLKCVVRTAFNLSLSVNVC